MRDANVRTANLVFTQKMRHLSKTGIGVPRALIFVASRNILADEELFVHYALNYDMPSVDVMQLPF